AKRFETPDVRADIGVVVAARDTDIAVLGKRPVLAGTKDPRATGDLGDVVVGWTWGAGAADLDDRADRRFLGSGGVRQRHVVDPPVDAVNDGADTVAELVGELLVDQAANDGRRHLLAMQAEAFGTAQLAAGGERPVDGFDDVAAFAERAHGRLKLIRER